MNGTFGVAMLPHYDLLATEECLLRIPYEELNRQYKQMQTAVEKEMMQVASSFSKLSKKKDDKAVLKALNSAIKRLKGLRQRLHEYDAIFQQLNTRVQQRVQYLHRAIATRKDPDAELRWHKQRLDRLLVDHLLRSGFQDTALQVAEEGGVSDYVDVEPFQHSQQIVEALNRRDCAPALEWCSENKSKLKKMKSTLEFNLRIQEFVELCRSQRIKDAMEYARTHLIKTPAAQLARLQEAMACLAFPPDTTCAKYKRLYDEEQWKRLVTEFRKDHLAVYNCTETSVLVISMKAGLAALKTRACYQPDQCNPNCPVCTKEFRPVCKGLPFSHHVQSRLVCRISGEVMDEHNPPMVLPNGSIYAKKAMEEMAKHHNGKVVDPRTHDSFAVDELQRAYIM